MSLDVLQHELGHRLTTKEVAEYLGLDEDSVRKHYQALGGVRPTGPTGRILFFEKLIVEALRRCSNAVEDQEARTDSLEGQSPEGSPDKTEALRHQGGSPGVGGAAARKRLGEDRHGIFPR